MSRKKSLAGAGCACDTGSSLGILQDFTTYDEWEQTGNPIRVLSTERVQIVNFINNKKDYLSKPIAGLWDGDLVCHQSVFMSGGGGNPSYALIGASDTWVFPFSAEFVGIRLNEASAYKRLQLVEKYGTTYNYGGYLTIPASTWAHFKLRVDKTVGTYGTLYLQLFTDNTFTTPTGSEISLTLLSAHAFGYWHAISNGYTGLVRYWNGYIERTHLLYGA